MTDFADFQLQTRGGLNLGRVQFWSESDKNCDRESAADATSLMAALSLRHQIHIFFYIWEKATLAIVLKIICNISSKLAQPFRL